MGIKTTLKKVKMGASISNLSLQQKNVLAALAHAGSFAALLVAYNKWGKTDLVMADLFRYKLPNPEQLEEPLANSDGMASTMPQNEEEAKCKVKFPLGPPKKISSFNKIYLVLCFFALTAAFHLGYAYFPQYNGFVRDGWNPLRWVEYGISASFMAVLIGNSLGVVDAWLLLVFALVNVAMQTCGFIVDSNLRNSVETNWYTVYGATFAGWVLLMSIWIPSIASLANLAEDFKQYPTTEPVKIPNFVYFILGVQILNFSSFGFIQLRQILDARNAEMGGSYSFFKSYENVESAYITLSFAGKLALASGLGYGILFRTKDCP